MAIQRSDLSKSLEALTKKVEAENSAQLFEKSTNDLALKLESLEENSTDNSKELARLFKVAIEKIDNPESSRQAVTAAKKQLEKIDKLAGTEEQRRETEKANNEQNDRLGKIVEGIKGMSSQLSEFVQGAKKGVGWLAGLGALGLLFFDPETLGNMLTDAVNFIFDTIESIRLFLEGDFSGGLKKLEGHFLGLSVALGGILLFFGGPIFKVLSVIGKLITGAGKIIGKLFGMGSKIKGLAAAGDDVAKGASKFSKIADFFKNFGSKFSKFGSIFKTVLGKIALPITLIIGVLSGLEQAIVGFKEDGIIGGIKGFLKGAFDSIIGGLLDLIKDGLSWVLKLFGFDNIAEVLDSFSFSELYSNWVDKVFELAGKVFSWLGEKTTAAIEWIKEKFELAGNVFSWLGEKTTAAIEWIKEKLGFGEEDGFKLPSFSIGEMVTNAVEKIKNLFTSIFDFLPSFEDIKGNIKSILPSWLGGSDDKVAESSPRISSTGVISPTNQAIPVYVSSPNSGVMEGTNNMIATRSAADTSATVAIIGSGGGSRNTSNVSANNFNISQGMTSDDFVRRDFINAFG